jgi:hypothetical protein
MGPYLELYARRERGSWTTWGNELAYVAQPRSASAGAALAEQVRAMPAEPKHESFSAWRICRLFQFAFAGIRLFAVFVHV